MADLMLVAAIVAFFAICVLYIGWCDHIIGPDDFGPEPDADDGVGVGVGVGVGADGHEVTA